LLAGVACVSDDDDVMVITNEGVIIRTDSVEIPTYKRSTTGVRVMKLGKDQTVANMTLVEKEEENAEGVDENEVDLTEAPAQEAEIVAENATSKAPKEEQKEENPEENPEE
jgi:DNA gyrase subunit A